MKPTLPPCPVCKTAKQVSRAGEFYRCGKCGGFFDDTPNEGSDVHADPSRRMELQERRKRCESTSTRKR